jgi:hypothetical protein
MNFFPAGFFLASFSGCSLLPFKLSGTAVTPSGAFCAAEVRQYRGDQGVKLRPWFLCRMCAELMDDHIIDCRVGQSIRAYEKHRLFLPLQLPYPLSAPVIFTPVGCSP